MLGLGALGFYAFSGRTELNAADLEGMPKLKILPLLDAKSGKSVELVAQKGNAVFVGNAANQTFRSNQSYLGPTVARNGGRKSRSTSLPQRFGTTRIFMKEQPMMFTKDWLVLFI